MTHHIHDAIAELQDAMTTFKTIAPPDGIGRLSVAPEVRRITVIWIRPTETYEWHHPDDETKAAALRDAHDHALHFLGVWTTRLTTLSGPDRKVLKNFGDYDVSVEVKTEDGWTFKATASAEMVCEIHPVVGDDGSPVMDEVEDQEVSYTTITKLVPRTTKICPPSFLAGMADEAG